MERKITLVAFMMVTIISLGLTQNAFAQASDLGGVAQQVQAGPSMPAGPVPIDGTWIEFSNQPPDPSVSLGCDPADPLGLICFPSSAANSIFGDAPPWTFTCPAGGCTLTVTDAFNLGDQFEVFDNAASIGSTPPVPLPAQPGAQCLGVPAASDPELCVLDPNSSTGIFNLGSGAHSITITRIASDPVIQFTAAYFKVQGQITVGGSDVSINTSALLLAGVQSISMWMIPVVIAGIGIGVFVIKRSHKLGHGE